MAGTDDNKTQQQSAAKPQKQPKQPKPQQSGYFTFPIFLHVLSTIPPFNLTAKTFL
jgi:hypothetical protein